MTAHSAAKSLQNQLVTFQSLEGKIAFLESLERGAEALRNFSFINDVGPEEKFLFLLLCALGQEHLFQGAPLTTQKIESFGILLNSIESFYRPIGGLLGYHILVLELIQREENGRIEEKGVTEELLPPPLFDLRSPSEDIQKATLQGLKMLPEMAEMYPVGGAGDRMNLIDEKSGRPLPVACLHFLGRTLLELLIRDLEAREYLYYKLFQKHLVTPIVLMTSEEKMNDAEIASILEKNNWFQRGKENFFHFVQPLVPIITKDGKWASTHSLELVVKPGGHGVIWKLAIDSGAFSWLREKGRKALIVRQINNPLAGIDSNLLTHFGLGSTLKRAFGFFSCPRMKGAQEGMNVLKVVGSRRTLTNIEYTDFARLQRDLNYDLSYPANTNILFADLEKIEEAVKKLPIPGALVNMKSSFKDSTGKEQPCARLESTMQNIADAFPEEEVFLLLNERAKTISVAKKSYDGNGAVEGTPEGAFQDLIKANCELLTKECGFEIRGQNGECRLPLFLYHPALGPLYSIISQKVHRGVLTDTSELEIEAHEVSIQALHLAGSLRIFGGRAGRCFMHNVTVSNAGIDREASNIYWKNEIKRKESLSITLEGDSAFFAENVEFHGDFSIVVPDGMEARAQRHTNGGVEIVKRPLAKENAWSWHYQLQEGTIKLSRRLSEG